MTDFNNKYVPQAPRTFQVAELKEATVKKSPLSSAARAKVVNRSGSNYLSENREGYGSCYVCDEDDTTYGKLTIEFKMACPAKDCDDKEAGYWHHNRSGCENSRLLITNKGYISCGGCGTRYIMSN